MDETKQRYAAKRSIILTKEQEEKIAQQNHQAIQNYVSELNQAQARRFELSSALLIATMTGKFEAAVDGDALVSSCRAIAEKMVAADMLQKFTKLKELFAELCVRGPIPALEWGAKQAGVVLFDPLPEAPEPLVKLAEPLNIDELTKVVQ